MRIIDADRLVKTIEKAQMESLRVNVLSLIHDAPTVELDESIIQQVLNKRCMTVVTNEYLIALHNNRPTGAWIFDGHNSTDTDEIYCCSICCEKLHTTVDKLFMYCPNCGARMGGEEE